MSAEVASRSDASSPWLVSPFYDLTFIIFSSSLLFVPHLVHSIWPSRAVVDVVITLFIGGPHLFATYTITFMEPNFRERYRTYMWGSLLLPVIIVSMAIWNLDVLVTVFFFWASIHSIHQAAYIADSYRFKNRRVYLSWSRLIDYGVLFTSIYPFATFKFTGARFRLLGMDLSSHAFETGGRVLLFPDFLKQDILAWLILVLFLFFFTAFVIKSMYEWRLGILHIPKTLHMLIASMLFFVTPLFQNLDVAFQGINTWHSFQYLAVVLYLNRRRADQGLIGSRFVTKLSRSGFRLYALCIAFTGAAAVSYLVVRGLLLAGGFWVDDPVHQHYFAFYVVILSCLLIHYYFDHFIFLQIDRVISPNWGTV